MKLVSPKLACVFTGQGAQYAQMGQALSSFDGFDALLEQYQRSSALPLKQWLFDSSEEVLKRTEVAQPVIYFYSLVSYSAFCEVFSPSGWIYAGHSLGEYSALAAAGVLDPELGLGVVHLRGKYMQEACPAEFGGMAAVVVRNVDDVVTACEALCDEFGQRHALVPANFNSDKQVVVSGRLECIRLLEQRYKDFGLAKVIPLKVSAPFHSPYMSPMKERFRDVCMRAIKSDGFSNTEATYIPNVTSELLKIATLTSTQVQHLLLEQLDHPVRWDLTSKYIGEIQGLDAVVEFGPKAVLGPMMKSVVSCPIYFVGCASDLEKVKEALR